MHMNTKTTFLKGFGVSVAVGVLSLVSAAPALADVLLASVAITASSGTTCINQPARITWSSTDATSVWIDQGIGFVAPYGEAYVNPTQTTTYTITGTNSMGGYAVASATIYVNAPCATPTPTPTPTNTTLYCSASYTYANSGDLVTFNAWGGDGNYSWNTSEGTPSYGYGSSFSTRFYNPSWYSVNRNVTVTSGYQATTCGVTVHAGAVITPTPTSSPTGQISVMKFGRNVTRGQVGEHASLVARSGDTLDFVIRVRSLNNSYLYNSYVTDILPGGLVYIPGSTTLNGYVVADGVTSAGLNVGTVSPSSDTVIKLSVRVDGAYVPASGTITVNNIVQARADGIVTRSASLPITLGQNASIATISTVKTGPADSLWLALAAAFLATGVYAGYTRTNLFGRRMAHAEIAQLAKTSGLNFAK